MSLPASFPVQTRTAIAPGPVGEGLDRAVIRLLRDMALCAGGTVLGARIDGPMAFLAMQAICSAPGFDPLASLAVHLQILPVTSAIMLLVALTCQWPGRVRRGAFTPRERVSRWASYALRVALQFAAMMLAMSLMQVPFRAFLPASPSSAVLAAVAGMLALAVLGAALRPLALRVPFLVPLCCR